MHSTIHIRVFPSVFEKKGGGKGWIKGAVHMYFSLSPMWLQCHVQSWGGLLCFTLRQDSRFPRLGGRLYATIKFEMGI